MLRAQPLLASSLLAGAAEAKGHRHSVRDASHGKALSLEEFQAKRGLAAKAKVEKLDANHDCSLDQSERAAGKKRGKARHRKHKAKG